MSVLGVVLAAGAGTRFGGPKALACGADGTPWSASVAVALAAGGCERVTVAIGASADAARALVPTDVETIVVTDWASGLSATMRRVLAHAAAVRADAVLIAPVDVPGISAAACRRVLDAGAVSPRTALARAAFSGSPGHPALIGRDHWGALGVQLQGDRGAGGYLAEHGATTVECSDLWDGADIDAPL
jgi:CTP:molybdopterin cytidylyltransferase MocA